PSSYLADTLDEKRKTQKRQNYNFFIKGHYDVSENLRLEASYAYAPSFSNYFIRNTKNSSFDMLTGGHQAGVKALWDNKLGHLSAQTNVNYMDSSRINSAVNMLGWRASPEKNWTNNLESGTVSEGGYGNVDTKQINLNVKINQDFEPLSVGFWGNRISVGGDFGYVNAYYERMEDMLFGGTAWLAPLKNGQTCLSSDISCSTSPVYFQGGNNNLWQDNTGQYAYRLSFYKAGKIRLDSLSFGFYAEDDMRFDLYKAGEINTRIGLRLDGDNYMGKVTLSPRFSLNYILPHSKLRWGRHFATQLTFGASRYYGRNLFTFRLMEERSSLEYSLARSDASKSWEEIMANEANKKTSCYNRADCFNQNKNDTNFKKLRVPYTDELMGGITQKIYAFILSAKYIYRAGKDEIRRMCQAPDGSLSTMSCTSDLYMPEFGINARDSRFVYTNLGQSSSDVVSLSITNNGGLDFGGIKNSILFAFDWTNVRRNYNDYDTSIDANALNNEMIWWGGEVIRYDMR
ncbi:TonB-dependent receptor, partial [Helicobacter sp. T3_23-1056]